MSTSFVKAKSFDGTETKLDKSPFYFDLDRMTKAVDSPAHTVPTNLSTKEFIEWMKSKKTKG